jgi:hypothetical protein
MDATKTTTPKGDSQRQCANLDKRYGKIGISAVAAALLHQNGPRNENETRTIPYERDWWRLRGGRIVAGPPAGLKRTAGGP